jgi:uncharacterized membrane protein YgdD (TMEM256/DUF423 family)
MQNARFYLLCASVSLFIAIGCGAFGAHALKKMLSNEMLAIWQTAVQYQFVHGLAFLGFAGVSQYETQLGLRSVAYCLLTGMLIFCGSLYVLALTEVRVLGAITPIGGLAFLVGWGLLALRIWKNK